MALQAHTTPPGGNLRPPRRRARLPRRLGCGARCPKARGPRALRLGCGRAGRDPAPGPAVSRVPAVRSASGSTTQRRRVFRDMKMTLPEARVRRTHPGYRQQMIPDFNGGAVPPSTIAHRLPQARCISQHPGRMAHCGYLRVTELRGGSPEEEDRGRPVRSGVRHGSRFTPEGARCRSWRPKSRRSGAHSCCYCPRPADQGPGPSQTQRFAAERRDHHGHRRGARELRSDEASERTLPGQGKLT